MQQDVSIEESSGTKTGVLSLDVDVDRLDNEETKEGNLSMYV